MRCLIRPAVMTLLLFTVLTGVIYPLLVMGVAQLVFPRQAKGSVILRDGKPVGSELIAQPFTDPRYFWPRPSAATYDAAAGAGSNLGPSNPALHEAVRERVAAVRATDPGNAQPVPVDLVTASASGLDPHISPAAARYQAARVARLHKLPLDRVEQLIDEHTEGRWLGLIGEPRVNVLALNLALDATR